MSLPLRKTSPQHQSNGQASFDNIVHHIETGNTEEAASLLKQFAFEGLRPEDALMARALALQLSVDRGQHIEALFHADAALEITEEEPLIFHLMGQALWATDYLRAGAEALVRAAELFETIEAGDRKTNLPVDALAIYFMAGEACKHFKQYEAALSFFQKALHHNPELEEITHEISALKNN
ncbi:MAG: hypothetical protein ACE5G0_20385 [Rhodothermales bacterium]